MERRINMSAAASAFAKKKKSSVVFRSFVTFLLIVLYFSVVSSFPLAASVCRLSLFWKILFYVVSYTAKRYPSYVSTIKSLYDAKSKLPIINQLPLRLVIIK
jgi:hypothetical protein